MALSSASASGLPAVSSRRFGVKGGKSSKNSGVPIGKFSDKGEVPPHCCDTAAQGGKEQVGTPFQARNTVLINLPKAHAPPALTQHGSGPAGYVLDQFSQLAMNDDHLYRDPDYPWEAYLQSS